MTTTRHRISLSATRAPISEIPASLSHRINCLDRLINPTNRTGKAADQSPVDKSVDESLGKLASSGLTRPRQRRITVASLPLKQAGNLTNYGSESCSPSHVSRDLSNLSDILKGAKHTLRDCTSLGRSNNSSLSTSLHLTSNRFPRIHEKHKLKEADTDTTSSNAMNLKPSQTLLGCRATARDVGLSPAAERYERHIRANMALRNRSNPIEERQPTGRSCKTLETYYYPTGKAYDNDLSQQGVDAEIEELMDASLWREKVNGITRWQQEVNNAIMAGETDITDVFRSPDPVFSLSTTPSSPASTSFNNNNNSITNNTTQPLSTSLAQLNPSRSSGLTSIAVMDSEEMVRYGRTWKPYFPVPDLLPVFGPPWAVQEDTKLVPSFENRDDDQSGWGKLTPVHRPEKPRYHQMSPTEEFPPPRTSSELEISPSDLGLPKQMPLSPSRLDVGGSASKSPSRGSGLEDMPVATTTGSQTEGTLQSLSAYMQANSTPQPMRIHQLPASESWSPTNKYSAIENLASRLNEGQSQTNNGLAEIQTKLSVLIESQLTSSSPMNGDEPQPQWLRIPAACRQPSDSPWKHVYRAEPVGLSTSPSTDQKCRSTKRFQLAVPYRSGVPFGPRSPTSISPRKPNSTVAKATTGSLRRANTISPIRNCSRNSGLITGLEPGVRPVQCSQLSGSIEQLDPSSGFASGESPVPEEGIGRGNQTAGGVVRFLQSMCSSRTRKSSLPPVADVPTIPSTGDIRRDQPILRKSENSAFDETVAMAVNPEHKISLPPVGDPITVELQTSRSTKFLLGRVASNEDICIQTQTPFTFTIAATDKEICITKIASVDDLRVQSTVQGQPGGQEIIPVANETGNKPDRSREGRLVNLRLIFGSDAQLFGDAVCPLCRSSPGYKQTPRLEPYFEQGNEEMHSCTRDYDNPNRFNFSSALNEPGRAVLDRMA